jgi:hypothetical protein
MELKNIRIATRVEILAHIKSLGKSLAHDEKDINEQIDWHVRQGHNFIHLQVTELIPSGTGCYAQNADEEFIVSDFNKEYQRLWTDDMDNVERRRDLIDCWETVVKMEREAEKREAEYVRGMMVVKDKLDRGKIRL